MTLANIGSVLHNNGEPSEIWRGANSALPITLTFDFVSSQQINYVGLWQGVSASQGVKDFNLRFWDAASGSGNQVGGVFSGVLDSDSPIPLNGRSFDVGPRNGISSFTMEITSVADPGLHVHLGEVMVASSAVPEPSTFTLLGLGTIGLLVYRRRKHSAAA